MKYVILVISCDAIELSVGPRREGCVPEVVDVTLENFEMGDVSIGDPSPSEREESAGRLRGTGGTAFAAASAEAP